MDLSGWVGLVGFGCIIILAIQIAFAMIWCLDRLIHLIIVNKKKINKFLKISWYYITEYCKNIWFFIKRKYQ